MIEVIKTEKFEVKCGRCKATLQYEYSDVEEYKTKHDYLVKGVKCPVCSTVLSHE